MPAVPGRGAKGPPWEPRGPRRIHKTPAQRHTDACRAWLEVANALARRRAEKTLGPRLRGDDEVEDEPP